MSKVLIIEDEPVIIDLIRERLEAEGFACQSAMSMDDGLAQLAAFRPDLVLLDIILAGENGLDVLRAIRRESAALPVIIMTGQPNSELCLEAMRSGADKFIRKPLDLEELTSLIRRFTATAAKPEAPLCPTEECFAGKSQAILDLTQAVWKAASGQCDTLILGKSGTGKDFAARIIHRNGPRSGKPFYTIYMPTIPTTLFESELFGHEANAFTGAKLKRGRVEEAEGGILLLNEIGDMNLEQQAKLLEFLGEKTYVRVGGNERRSADVQLLACTNRNLEEAVREGTFRSDLYYRLQANVISLPSLRDHREDIEELANHFIQKYRGSKPVLAVDPELLREFQEFSWEGNVRELEFYIRQGLQHSPGPLIRRVDIPGLNLNGKTPPVDTLVSPGAWDSTWDEFQSRMDQLACQFLLYHIKQHHGNVAEAARSLGLSRETLNYKIKVLGLKTELSG